MTKISIGIPAYREGENIKRLILSLLAQRQEDFVLEEIIVVSDASSDNTASEVLSIKDSRVKLLENPERRGMAFSDNRIVKMFLGEILVILNADVLPEGNLFLEKLIKPFSADSAIGIVGGKISPLPPVNNFDRITSFGEKFKRSLAEKINHQDNIYLCQGRVRAFSRKFLDGFQWPLTVGEDAYSYLSCISRGFKFYYNKEAVVLFRAPGSFSDYRKQSTRFEASKKILGQAFDKNFVAKKYQIPFNPILSTSGVYFMKNPVLFLSYLGVYSRSRLAPGALKNSSVLWENVDSTKKLN